MKTLYKIAFYAIVVTWVVRFIGLVVVLLLIAGTVSYCQMGKQVEAPEIEKAPWAIQTYSNDEMRIPSRIYFAETLEYDGNTPVIKNYYRLDGDNFVFVKGEKRFPLDQYGKLDISRRH